MTPTRLKIMIVDENELRGQALAHVLRELGYQVVGRVASGDYLPTRVTETKPDVVLIDLASPSRDTLEQLSVLHRDDPKPVVMFSMDDDAQTIQAAVCAGVSAYIVDGMSQARVKPIIDVAIAHFHAHQSLRDELRKTRDSLEERKVIDRAKGILMKEHGVDEDTAFGMLRRLAMDGKKRLGEAAEDVVQKRQATAQRRPPPGGRLAS